MYLIQTNVSQEFQIVAHESELVLLFGPVPTPVEDEFANQMLGFYINFVNDLNPGGKHQCRFRIFFPSLNLFHSEPWPQFTSDRKQLLQLMRDNITVVDDGERPGVLYLISNS